MKRRMQSTIEEVTEEMYGDDGRSYLVTFNLSVVSHGGNLAGHPDDRYEPYEDCFYRGIVDICDDEGEPVDDVTIHNYFDDELSCRY